MKARCWIAVTCDEGAEDMEAYGPFTSGAAAEKFVEEYEDQGVRPAYPLIVLELYGVRTGLAAIREAKRENERLDRT